MSRQLIYALLAFGTSIWVGVDASNLGMRRGRLGGGLIDMSVLSWIICCLLFWIVSFPCYLVARSRYKELAWSGPAGQLRQGLPPAQAHYAGASQTNYPPYAPPQMSPDGRWWWNGQQWVAVAPPMVPGQQGGI